MVIQEMAEISEDSWVEGEERDFEGEKTRVRELWVKTRAGVYDEVLCIFYFNVCYYYY